MKKTKLDKFQEQAQKHVDALRVMFEHMPFQGDTSSESQKIYLLNVTNKLERAINGIEKEDLQFKCSHCDTMKDYLLPRQCPKCCNSLAGL